MWLSNSSCDKGMKAIRTICTTLQITTALSRFKRIPKIATAVQHNPIMHKIKLLSLEIYSNILQTTMSIYDIKFKSSIISYIYTNIDISVY